MKRILITGQNSYIGNSFEQYLETYVQEHPSSDYTVHKISLRREDWRKEIAPEYDTVLHVSGLAHADTGNATQEMKAAYTKVNSELTVQCAKAAKEAGIGQFIFLSSIIVYGDGVGLGREKCIDRQTSIAPAGFYGESKVKAEEGLLELEDDSFRVVILRLPMVYGKDSRGNYRLLSRLAGKCPVFPSLDNSRSMIYIENLCEFIRLMAENEERGIFFPQNKEYVRTCDLVAEIAKAKGKRILFTSLFNPMLRLLSRSGGKLGGMVNKAFGSMTYEKGLSRYRDDYNLVDFEESVRRTEKGMSVYEDSHC